MALEVSVADRDALQSLWQASIAESQKRPLGFWSKGTQSLVGNYFTFVDNCWPALGLSGNWILALDHQVTMLSDLFIMSCMSSNPPNHKTESAEHKSIIKWKCYIQDWSQASPCSVYLFCGQSVSFPSHPIIAQMAREQDCHGGRDGDYAWFQ